MRALIAACLLAAVAAPAAAADCKGERICVQEACIEPPPGPDEAPGPAAAAPPGAKEADPTYRRHLGLYIRPDVGFGYMSMSASRGGLGLERPTGTFGIAIGQAVSENNLIAFHIWGSAVKNPSASSGGPSSSMQFDKFFALTGFGFEYTAYSSQNFYFSITPSVTVLHLYDVSHDSDNQDKDTNLGFGGRFAVGKEWWVADHFGLGLAAHLSASYNYDAWSVGTWWTTWSATIALSATYN